MSNFGRALSSLDPGERRFRREQAENRRQAAAVQGILGRQGQTLDLGQFEGFRQDLEVGGTGLLGGELSREEAFAQIAGVPGLTSVGLEFLQGEQQADRADRRQSAADLAAFDRQALADQSALTRQREAFGNQRDLLNLQASLAGPIDPLAAIDPGSQYEAYLRQDGTTAVRPIQNSPDWKEAYIISDANRRAVERVADLYDMTLSLGLGSGLGGAQAATYNTMRALLMNDVRELFEAGDMSKEQQAFISNLIPNAVSDGSLWRLDTSNAAALGPLYKQFLGRVERDRQLYSDYVGFSEVLRAPTVPDNYERGLPVQRAPTEEEVQQAEQAARQRAGERGMRSIERQFRRGGT